MTKFAVVAVLLLVNAAFGANVFLGNKNKMTVGVFAQLQAIETTSFGKNLLDTVALQVQNKAPLSDIAQLLTELRNDLLAQQAREDSLHQEREDECARAIADYDEKISFASSEIQDATSRIRSLTNRIGELEVSIKGYQERIAKTEETRDNAIAERATRAQQFVSRTAQHQSVLDALDIILEKLSAYGAQALEDETALLQLAKIGKNNPIAAFVQVAAALSPESWQNVKNKLQALRDATAASLTEDADRETEEINAHNKYVADLNKFLEGERAGLALDEEELREHRADLAQQEIRLDTNTTALKAAQEGKAAKEDQCKLWRDQYFAESAQRSSEIDIVQQVQEIFAQKLDTAQGYLRERMEADRS